MNLEEMMAVVREQMPNKRWQHTLGVMSESVRLAKRYGGDPDKAELAALLHDMCKAWPIEEQRRVIEENRLDTDVLDHEKELWHAHAGAQEAKLRFGIDDEEVLDAIRYHTSGRVGMTLLDKIVCLADYIEPGRDFPEVNKIRKLAEHSLEEALVAGYNSTIALLLDRGKNIYPLTVAARNGLLDELKRGQ
jgi:predicted HD superfamily hydrolase involved in NAD metabolism